MNAMKHARLYLTQSERKRLLAQAESAIYKLVVGTPAMGTKTQDVLIKDSRLLLQRIRTGGVA